MNNYSVFSGLNSEEIVGLKKCLGENTVFFKKGEHILEYSPTGHEIGIIEEGLVYLVSISNSGEENIIDFYEPGGIFGKPLSTNTSVNLFNFVAKRDSKIWLVDQEIIVRNCKNTCKKHMIFIKNVINAVSCRNQMHLDVLLQRSIRQKLMSYFHYLSEKGSVRQFTLQLPLSDLAAFLGVDRSAMMRELKKLNSEGILRSKGQSITLLS